MTVRNTCISKLSPDSVPTDRIPIASEFPDGDDYLPAPLIEDVAQALIDHYPEFEHLSEYSIGYFWRSEAPTRNGKKILGDHKKTSGLLKHVSECTFVVEVAALQARLMTGLQLEALVYHELSHLQEEENDKGIVKPVIVDHDAGMFRAEIETYGLWHRDLRLAEKSFRQLELGANPGEDITPELEAAAEFVDKVSQLDDGITTTISAGGKSVTIPGKKQK